MDRRAANGEAKFIGFYPRLPDPQFPGFPELVHYKNDVGQGQARANVSNIAWDIQIDRPNEPFYCDRKYSKG